VLSSNPFSFKWNLVLMVQASCNMVLFMSSGMLLDVRQKFRLRPKGSLEPGGSLKSLQRLWKV
jgi:hypothetical protein